MIYIQKQTWTSLTRYVLMADKGEASVMLELYNKPVGERKLKAYIFALWVDPEHRRQGLATILMERVEELARREGHKEIWLEWDKNDAIWPDKNYALEIFKWYEGRGYQQVEFGEHCALMRKELSK